MSILKQKVKGAAKPISVVMETGVAEISKEPGNIIEKKADGIYAKCADAGIGYGLHYDEDGKIALGMVNAPNITAPVADAKISVQGSMTVTTSAFSVVAVSDTHATSDYVVSKNADRSEPVIEQYASTDKTSHVISDLSGLDVDSEYYISVRHNGANVHPGQWSEARKIQTVLGEYTKSGRLIYRHANGMGSVLEYTEFGKPRKLFIADARYRTTMAWNTGSSITAAGTLIPYSASGNNPYLGNGALLFGSSTTTTKTLGAKTDAELTTFAPGLAYAKTDAEYNDMWGTQSQAVNYCRNLTNVLPGGMYVPGFYTNYVLYIEGDYIDAIDPTLSSYRSYALGLPSGNTYREFNGTHVYTVNRSPEGASVNRNMNTAGGIYNGMTHTMVGGIVPVAFL